MAQNQIGVWAGSQGRLLSAGPGPGWTKYLDNGTWPTSLRLHIQKLLGLFKRMTELTRSLARMSTRKGPRELVKEHELRDEHCPRIIQHKSFCDISGKSPDRGESRKIGSSKFLGSGLKKIW